MEQQKVTTVKVQIVIWTLNGNDSHDMLWLCVSNEKPSDQRHQSPYQTVQRNLELLLWLLEQRTNIPHISPSMFKYLFLQYKTIMNLE